MKLVLVAAFLAVYVNAECHNGCSGNGRCTNYKMMFSSTTDTSQVNHLPTAGGTQNLQGYNTANSKKDSCTCFTRVEDGSTVYAYTGADCSLLTCPYGNSWDSAPYAANNHNQLVECSHRGTCDRKTGTCECFEGYEGKGCRRTTCPNDCSLHGTCKSIHEIAKLMSENTVWSALSEFEYTKIQYLNSWDSNKIRGCMCDAGWRGPDCSEREAPSGADPMGGPGAEKGRVCSGRGYTEADGICICYKGFFGTSCGEQRANVL